MILGAESDRKNINTDTILRHFAYNIRFCDLNTALKQTIKKLKKNKDKLLSGKLSAKRRARVPRKKGSCKERDPQCNSVETYCDHVHSPKHKKDG